MTSKRRAPISLGGIAPRHLARLRAHTSPAALQRQDAQETPAALPGLGSTPECGERSGMLKEA